MSESIVPLKMTGYNHIKELATFSFIRETGSQTTMVIQKETFLKLMRGDYDNDNSPEKASDLQSSFKRVVLREIKKDYEGWFDNEANKICSDFLNQR